MRSFVCRSTAAIAAAALIAVVLPIGIQPAAALSAGTVIGEVYGGGGNSGATLRNDFIELFNRGTTPVDLSGWSVQYASASGTTWAVTNLSGSVPPGGHHLVQEAQGSGGTTNLPAPDSTGNIAMSATSGKVALVSSMTPLTCGADCDKAPGVADFVGYGSANDFEGSAPAPALSNTTADHRATEGCTETDDNRADFSAGAPGPESSATAAAPCDGGGDMPPAVASRTPAPGATGVDPSSAVTVGFSEPVAVTDGWYAISCATTGAHPATATSGPMSFTLDPSTDFGPNETCTVTIVASHVSDQDTDDPPDSLAADDTWTFQTAAPATPTRIREIQGAGHRSPLVGQTVSGVTGVVTARRSNGIYVQDSAPDADPATSEGIFVFTGSAPAPSLEVGDGVIVSGTVAEFTPGGTGTGNLSITQISSPAIVETGVAPVPAPTVIGVGGRVPPTTVIDDDGLTSFDEETDGIDFYESLEGMVVQVNGAVAVGPTSDFGEIPVLADGGAAGAGLRTPRGGIVIRPGDFNPERIIIDDAIAPTPAVDVGDSLTSAVIGVIDYSFGNFKLLTTSPLTAVDGGLAPETTALVGTAAGLTAATFNVENLDPGDGPRIDALAQELVANLKAPAIVNLEEVQDNNGPVNDTVVDGSASAGAFITAVQAAGGPTYQYREIDPVDDQDGGEPGGNIRVGFLFDPARVGFIDRPGGGPTTATSVVTGATGPQLSASPGRIDPTNPAFANSRKPLAGEFTFNGRRVFVIGNHLNSKGGDQPLFGANQPPVLRSEAQRVQQAQVIRGFVDQILAQDPNAPIVVLGDFNDFAFSPPLAALTAGEALVNLTETLPEAERYTYVFDGNSQALDHILISQGLVALGAEYDIVHANSEFGEQATDHDVPITRLALGDVAQSVVAIGDAAVHEGDSGQTVARFEASLSESSPVPVTVQFAIGHGTTDAADLNRYRGTVTFAPGETSKAIGVAVKGDVAVEEDETFAVYLSAPVNADIGDGAAEGVILDDDPVGSTPTVSIGSASVHEGDGSAEHRARLIATLSSPRATDVSVSYVSRPGTATAGADYRPTSGTIVIPAGATTASQGIVVLPDLAVEGNETFEVVLTAADGATVADSTGLVTIIDNDLS